MIWLALLGVAVLAMAPLAWSALAGGRVRGRRDAALALHRAQLGELDRDLAEHRLLGSEHAAAKLEVQRRLLAEADASEAAPSQSSLWPVWATAFLVPCAALLLYAAHGTPDYRAQATLAAQSHASAQDEALIARLRSTLQTMNPNDERTRTGYVMLGRAELAVGRLPEAAAAWRQALSVRFEPDLGAETAEIISETAQHVTPEAAALFKRALAEAPADVPWRSDAEKRVAEVGR